MKKATQIATQSKTTGSLFSGLKSVLRAGSLTLALLWLSLGVQAQFIRIDLDIEPQTSLSESSNFDLLLRPVDRTELPAEWISLFDKKKNFYRGHYFLQIRGNENFSVQARIRNSPALLSDRGESLPLMVQLAYRNDGTGLMPQETGGDYLFFPLSDSGLLIEHMKDSPQVLVASVFVQVTIAAPALTQHIYRGNIHLQLEYN